MDRANTQARSLVMKQLPFESLAQPIVEPGEHSCPWENVSGTSTIEYYSLPLKMELVEEQSQWLLVIDD